MLETQVHLKHVEALPTITEASSLEVSRMAAVKFQSRQMRISYHLDVKLVPLNYRTYQSQVVNR